MSDNISPDIGSLLLNTILSDGSFLDLDFLDDPALIGPAFDCDQLTESTPPEPAAVSSSPMEPTLEVVPTSGAASQSTPDPAPEHAAVQNGSGYKCIECDESFSKQGMLDIHGQGSNHAPYGCTCGRTFSRKDTLARHLKSNDPKSAEHICDQCDRRQHKVSFRRRDHLQQHMREYHQQSTQTRIKNMSLWDQVYFMVFPCHHSHCPDHRDVSFYRLPIIGQVQGTPFKSKRDYTKHMKDDHNESPFTCDILGCSRTGGKGYMRLKDLIKHHQKDHQSTVLWTDKSDVAKVRCPHPGCSSRHDFDTLNNHFEYVHWTREQLAGLWW